MSRPWMPFYVADYLADTGHLTTTQHGAYLLLIMHYWRTGGLPDDDKKLAKITRLPLKIWTDGVRPDLELLFQPGWKHKRIEKELERQNDIALKRAIAGQRGGMRTAIARINDKGTRLSKHAKREAIARQTPAIAQQTGGSHSHIENLSSMTESERIEPPRAFEKAGGCSPELARTIKERGWA